MSSIWSFTDIPSSIFQFPYALRVLPAYLREHWTSPEFEPYKAAFPEHAHRSPEALETYVRELSEKDVKVPCLKGLQGKDFTYSVVNYIPRFSTLWLLLKCIPSPTTAPHRSASAHAALGLLQSADPTHNNVPHTKYCSMAPINNVSLMLQ